MKIKVGDEGLIYLEPHFRETPRINNFLSIPLSDITEEFLNKDE